MRARSFALLLLPLAVAPMAACHGTGTSADGGGDSRQPSTVEVDGLKSGSPRGSYRVIEHQKDSPADAENKIVTTSGGKKIIFVNKNGGTYSPGNDDSSSNRSSIIGGTVKLPPYSEGAAAWSKFLTCIQDEFHPFDVEVTDQDPGPAPHIEAVIGGTPGMIGMSQGVGGVSPMTDDCALIDRAVVYVFSDVFHNPQVECEVAAQEIGHAIGMDHEYLCSDPMTYLSGCGHKTFQDQTVSCGEGSPRQCMCSAKQNSFQFLTKRLGAANGGNPPTPPPNGDTTPPIVAIVSPGDGATPADNTTISVNATATDETAMGDVVLMWEVNGTTMEMSCASPPGGVTCKESGNAYVWAFPVGTGPRVFSVKAVDAAGNTTVTAKRSIQLGGGGGAGGSSPKPPQPPSGGPDVDVQSPPASGTFHPGNTVTVRVSATDVDGVGEVWLRWKSPAGDVIYPLDPIGNHTWGIDLSISPSAIPGPRTLRVTAWDDQGEKTTAPDRVIQVQ